MENKVHFVPLICPHKVHYIILKLLMQNRHLCVYDPKPRAQKLVSLQKICIANINELLDRC